MAVWQSIHRCPINCIANSPPGHCGRDYWKSAAKSEVVIRKNVWVTLQIWGLEVTNRQLVRRWQRTSLVIIEKTVWWTSTLMRHHGLCLSEVHVDYLISPPIKHYYISHLPVYSCCNTCTFYMPADSRMSTNYSCMEQMELCWTDGPISP